MVVEMFSVVLRFHGYFLHPPKHHVDKRNILNCNQTMRSSSNKEYNFIHIDVLVDLGIYVRGCNSGIKKEAD